MQFVSALVVLLASIVSLRKRVACQAPIGKYLVVVALIVLKIGDRKGKNFMCAAHEKVAEIFDNQRTSNLKKVWRDWPCRQSLGQLIVNSSCQSFCPF